MNTENVTDEIWRDVILGKINGDYEFLALKILLARLRNKVKMESSPEVILKCIEELKTLFIRFGNLPSAQRDLEKILKIGA